MSTSQKKKRTSIKDKFKALQEIESGQPKSLVAQKYNVPRNTISTWLLPANKEKIMAAFSSGTISLKRKNLKAGKHDNLDKAVFKWFMSARSNNIPVSGLVLQEKASDLAKTLGIDDFKASNGWVDRWKARNNVTFKIVSGEAKSCTPEMTAHWKETHLPTILSRYKLQDIFNADEFGLFFQALPNKTLELKGEKCTGGKHSKVRLTGMSAASAAGEKLPLLVIGKAKNPRCFKNVKSLPCMYKAQTKSWMDSEIFTDWIKQLDRKFLAQNRKVAFIVDNCPAHPHVPGLTAIDLIYLPPNTTSVTQPMDQGVIRSLKAKYRAKVIRKYINAIDSNKELPNITILDAMIMLEQSWSTLPDTTIINCFKKAGISIQSQLSSTQDTDDPFVQLTEVLDELRALDPDLAPDGLTAETFIATDEEVATSIQSLPSDEELLHQFTNDDVEIIDDESDEMESTEKKQPSKKVLFEAIDLIENFALFQNDDIAKQLRKHTAQLNQLLTSSSRKKQSTIPSYFTCVTVE